MLALGDSFQKCSDFLKISVSLLNMCGLFNVEGQ